VLREELIALLKARAGRLYEVVGSRDTVTFDVRMLRKLVPDVSARDVYVCGPDGFSQGLISAVRRLGVPEQRIHRESFAF
jgi:ferredoxin-NADP reductase